MYRQKLYTITCGIRVIAGLVVLPWTLNIQIYGAQTDCSVVLSLADFTFGAVGLNSNESTKFNCIWQVYYQNKLLGHVYI
jgi:hypothetical protein